MIPLIPSSSSHINQLSLQIGVAAGTPNPQGQTDLHHACSTGDYVAVQQLLDSGTALDIPDEEGFFPLYLAGKKKHILVVNTILGHPLVKEKVIALLTAKNGPSQNTALDSECVLKSSEANRLMYDACSKGEENIVRLFLDAHAKFQFDSKTEPGPILDGSYLLYEAAKAGHHQIVSIILNHPLWKEETPQLIASTHLPYKNNPLHIACLKGHAAVVKVLLDAGTCLEKANEDGIIPFYYAALQGHLAVLEIIFNHPLWQSRIPNLLTTTNTIDQWTPLHAAAGRGHTHVVQLLLDAGASLTITDANGFLPLYVAAESGYLEVIKIMVTHPSWEAKASELINAPNTDSQTSLEIACFKGHHQVVHFLLDLGAPLDVPSKKNIYPLYLAAERGKALVVETILKHPRWETRASELVSAKNGTPPTTALDVACTDGHVEVVQALLDAGASLDEMNINEVSPLCIAVNNEHIDIVNTMLKHPLWLERSFQLLETKNDFGKHTPLHVACFNGSGPIVQLLLDAGASLGIPNSEGFLPLFLAVKQRHSTVVKLILSHAITQERRLEFVLARNGAIQKTTLHEACDQRDMEALWELLNACPEEAIDIIEVLMETGSTSQITINRISFLLCFAAKNGLTNLMIKLLDHPFVKANASTLLSMRRSSDKQTPLHRACHKGHLEIAQLLLNAGASLTIVDANECSPLFLACQRGHTALLEMIVSHPLWEIKIPEMIDIPNEHFHLSLLQVASLNGHRETVKLLLDKGAYCEEENQKYSPIYLAAKNGHVQVLNEIFNHPLWKAKIPALIDRPNGSLASTALLTACSNGHLEVVCLLLDAGASPNKPNTKGYFPLYYAAQNSHIQVIEVMLAHPSLRTTIRQFIAAFNGSKRLTAIHIACNQGHADIVRLLLERGGSLDVASSTGISIFPLYLAATRGHIQVFEKVLNHLKLQCSPLDVFHLCNPWDSSTPLHAACEKGHANVVQFLLDVGASLDAVNRLGITPIYFAAENGHVKVLEVILNHPRWVGKMQPILAIRGGRAHSILEIACINQHVEVFRMLLKAGAPLGEVSKYPRLTQNIEILVMLGFQMINILDTSSDEES